MIFPRWDPNSIYQVNGIDLNYMAQLAENIIIVAIAIITILSVISIIGILWYWRKAKRAQNKLRALATYVDDKETARKISEIAEEI